MKFLTLYKQAKSSFKMTAEKQIETSQILSVIWSLTYREVYEKEL